MAELNETIHPTRRLAICAFLVEVVEAEFAALRDSLHISDSSLSKHLATLREAGYVRVYKRTHDGRAWTWVALTRDGRTAYKSHIRALRQMTKL
ncbi:transcriptional regulator [Cryobacterium sp. PH31-L1]|uniref:transcriptional regulator n=1 Tax=Cryobacterium sp. PH31-L1 TaxID=3046199 RepID=UPI0024B9F1BE|nr:transcriptional regulator [Cryobacterium sp. PH31-L1]MDJ0379186.1 transcriptional regulator [Cryobacterium sp. PH31-L1]